MGFFQRLRWLVTPRARGSGNLWDNVNTPGSVGWGAAPPHASQAQAWPYDNFFAPGPNPEMYLKEGATYRDPFRLHASPRTLLPEIPVQEPRGSGAPTYINNTTPSTAQPQALPKSLPVRAIASPQTRQRELEYDAGDPRTLQRMVFSSTASQQYFNERTPLPEYTTPSVPTNMVIAGSNSYFPASMQHGWEQALVPEPGMRMNEVGASPPTLLSRPITVNTVQTVGGGRAPIKGAKAPKRKKSGG